MVVGLWKGYGEGGNAYFLERKKEKKRKGEKVSAAKRLIYSWKVMGNCMRMAEESKTMASTAKEDRKTIFGHQRPDRFSYKSEKEQKLCPGKKCA